jgi:hypothetical protein
MAWIALLGMPLRLNSTLTISTEGGFCLSKSWKPLIGSPSGHHPGPFGDVFSTILNHFSVYCKQSPPNLWNLALQSGHLIFPPKSMPLPATSTSLTILTLVSHTKCFSSPIAFLHNVLQLLVTANVPS